MEHLQRHAFSLASGAAFATGGQGGAASAAESFIVTVTDAAADTDATRSWISAALPKMLKQTAGLTAGDNDSLTRLAT